MCVELGVYNTTIYCMEYALTAIVQSQFKTIHSNSNIQVSNIIVFVRCINTLDYIVNKHS